jgi:hypothetical protein
VSDKDLPELLRRLHEELGRAESLDAESRALLGVVAQDLAKFEAHMSATRSAAVRFEADHPALAAALRQVADAFGKAGI